MSKLKSYNFWIKLASASLLLLRIIGSKLGYEIDSILFMDIVTAVAGILVVMGIISAPTVITTKNGEEIMKEEIQVINEVTDQSEIVTEHINDQIIDSVSEGKKSEESDLLVASKNADILQKTEKISTNDAINGSSVVEIAKDEDTDEHKNAEADEPILGASEDGIEQEKTLIKKYLYKADGSIVELEDGEIEDIEELKEYSRIETVIIEESPNVVMNAKETSEDIPSAAEATEINPALKEQDEAIVDTGEPEKRNDGEDTGDVFDKQDSTPSDTERVLSDSGVESDTVNDSDAQENAAELSSDQSPGEEYSENSQEESADSEVKEVEVNTDQPALTGEVDTKQNPALDTILERLAKLITKLEEI